MNIEIITEELIMDVYGFSGVVADGDYTGMAFKLSGSMWEIVKTNNINNKGKNIWIYEQNNSVFAGVELADTGQPFFNLEYKQLRLATYAYYKHVGPYSLIKQAGLAMKEEIKKHRLETVLPYIEIYGHWSNDESKLETELLMCLG